LKYFIIVRINELKTKILLGLLIAIVIISSSFSAVEAHPHANIDLMDSHSHDPNSENFQENFIFPRDVLK
jgi:hypothetical protein